MGAKRQRLVEKVKRLAAKLEATQRIVKCDDDIPRDMRCYCSVCDGVAIQPAWKEELEDVLADLEKNGD